MKYKILHVRENVHTALKLRATMNKRSIIDELDDILRKELEVQDDE